MKLVNYEDLNQKFQLDNALNTLVFKVSAKINCAWAKNDIMRLLADTSQLTNFTSPQFTFWGKLTEEKIELDIWYPQLNQQTEPTLDTRVVVYVKEKKKKKDFDKGTPLPYWSQSTHRAHD